MFHLKLWEINFLPSCIYPKRKKCSFSCPTPPWCPSSSRWLIEVNLLLETPPVSDLNVHILTPALLSSHVQRHRSHSSLCCSFSSLSPLSLWVHTWCLRAAWCLLLLILPNKAQQGGSFSHLWRQDLCLGTCTSHWVWKKKKEGSKGGSRVAVYSPYSVFTYRGLLSVDIEVWAACW